MRDMYGVASECGISIRSGSAYAELGTSSRKEMEELLAVLHAAVEDWRLGADDDS